MDYNSSEEKTEKPTEDKKRKSREQGQILKSQELNSLLTGLVALIVLSLLIVTIFEPFNKFVTNLWTLNLVGSELPALGPLFNGLAGLFKYLLAIFLLIVLIGFLQVGLMFNFKSFKPNFSKIIPGKGFHVYKDGKFFSSLFRAVLKVSFLLLLVVMSFEAVYSYVVVGYVLDEITTQLKSFFVLAMKLLFVIILFLLLPVSIDYFQSRKSHFKKLMMSKRELKEEYKRKDGDPQIKQKRKELYKKWLEKNKGLSNLGDADLIITNPIHFLVALRYDPEQDKVPVVIFKTSNEGAVKIRSKAIQFGLYVVEDKKLARSIYNKSEIGHPIPEESYLGVAKWLIKKEE